MAIKFCFKIKLSAKNTFEMLQKAYDESCLKNTTVYGWLSRFRDSRDSAQFTDALVDNPRSGRPFAKLTDENIAAVAVILKEDY
jgi:hypothetical protein